MKGAVVEEAALVMAEGDTVATAIEDLGTERSLDVQAAAVDDEAAGGESEDGETVTLAEDVPFGHKFALASHEPGDPVRKYGEVIGLATEPIAAGEWVHTHNLESGRGRGDLNGSGRAEETDGSGDVGDAGEETA